MTSKTKYERRQARKDRKEKRKAKEKMKALESKKELAVVDRTQTQLPEVTLRGTEGLAPLEVLLMRMLSYKRPGGTKVEEAWIQEFIVKPVENQGYELHEDWMGNLYVHIGDPEEHKTLFSAHTDTVHTTDGTQSLEYDATLGILGLKSEKPKEKTPVRTQSKWKSVWNSATGKNETIRTTVTTPVKDTDGNVKGTLGVYEDDYETPFYDNYYGGSQYSGYSYGSYTRGCLGADDGTGVFIMVQMILSDIKGTYVFHREEETGGQGSNHIAMTQNDRKHKRNKSVKGRVKSQDPLGVNDVYAHELDLTMYDRAIAFDRKGTTDIITDQFGTCASYSFSDALAYKLNTAMGIALNDYKNRWKGCAGVFTDTANYVDYIPECTNLSVGYYDQHTGLETQDIPFALKLLAACKKIDWYTLPVSRIIGSKSYQDTWDDIEGDGYQTGKASSVDLNPYAVLPDNGFVDVDDALDVVMTFPEEVAQLLVDWYGVDSMGVSLNSVDYELDDDEEKPDPVG